MSASSGAYPPVLDGILRRLRARGAPPLRPRAAIDAELVRAIEDLDAAAAGTRDGDFFRCLQSGLHLWNDDLDRAHAIAQAIATPTGSYWHAIMHRREGDFGNSKYWFRRVGEHEVFERLLKAGQALAREHVGDPFARSVAAAARWDPFAFVDACESAHGEVPFLVALQMQEIERLVVHCCERAMDAE